MRMEGGVAELCDITHAHANITHTNVNDLNTYCKIIRPLANDLLMN